MDWGLLLEHVARLLCAYALALPIAWNRERVERSAGLRTFPLVSVASCGYLLLARSTLGSDPNALGRILQGLMTGIGFIGGGAILKQPDRVHGTATASSIWCTGALGSAVAFDRWDIAVLLSFVNYATFRWLTRFKHDPEQPWDGGGEANGPPG